MPEQKEYLRTDMAAECYPSEESGESLHGIRFTETHDRGFELSRLTILDREGAAILGKPVGSYVTVTVGKIWLDTDERYEQAVELLADELLSMARTLSPSLESVLVAGLGNREITSDAIGPLTVKHLTVTRHIKELDPKLFDRLGSLPLSAIAPGVIGQTGIETAALIRGAADTALPSLVLCVDALAAKSVDRLAVTVQLSDTGIAPGSGIGNHRRAIDRTTVGVPVLAIGVPTVVDSSTMVSDMLERAGVEEISPSLRRELDNGRSFFVTVKDTDTATGEMAKLIAAAIDRSFCHPMA